MHWHGCFLSRQLCILSAQMATWAILVPKMMSSHCYIGEQSQINLLRHAVYTVLFSGNNPFHAIYNNFQLKLFQRISSFHYVVWAFLSTGRSLYFCDNQDKKIAEPPGFKLRSAGPSQIFSLVL